MKRVLSPHESWEHGPLCMKDLIVLSGLDDIVNAEEVKNRATIDWPHVKVIHQHRWQHGGFLLESDPDHVNNAVIKHVYDENIN